jgi:hypothetical protein
MWRFVFAFILFVDFCCKDLPYKPPFRGKYEPEAAHFYMRIVHQFLRYLSERQAAKQQLARERQDAKDSALAAFPVAPTNVSATTALNTSLNTTNAAAPTVPVTPSATAGIAASASSQFNPITPKAARPSGTSVYGSFGPPPMPERLKSASSRPGTQETMQKEKDLKPDVNIPLPSAAIFFKDNRWLNPLPLPGRQPGNHSPHFDCC